MVVSGISCEILTHVIRETGDKSTDCNERCKDIGCPFVNKDLFFPKTKIEEPQELEVDEREIMRKRIGRGESLLGLIEGRNGHRSR